MCGSTCAFSLAGLWFIIGFVGFNPENTIPKRFRSAIDARLRTEIKDSTEQDGVFVLEEPFE